MSVLLHDFANFWKTEMHICRTYTSQSFSTVARANKPSRNENKNIQGVSKVLSDFFFA